MAVAITFTGCQGVKEEKQKELSPAQIKMNEDQSEKDKKREEFGEPIVLSITLKDKNDEEIDTISLTQVYDEFKVEASYLDGPRRNIIYVAEMNELLTWLNDSAVSEQFLAVDAITDLSIDSNYPALGLGFAVANFVGKEDMDRWEGEGKAIYLLRAFNFQTNPYTTYGHDLSVEYTVKKGENSSEWEFTFKSKADEVVAKMSMNTPKEFKLSLYKEFSEHKAKQIEDNVNKFIIKQDNKILLEKNITTTKDGLTIDLQEPVTLTVKDAIFECFVNDHNRPLGNRMIGIVIQPGRSINDMFAAQDSEVIIKTVDELMKNIGKPTDFTNAIIEKRKFHIQNEMVQWTYIISKKNDQGELEEIVQLITEFSDKRSIQVEDLYDELHGDKDNEEGPVQTPEPKEMEETKDGKEQN